jgi:hypothetical protein
MLLPVMHLGVARSLAGRQDAVTTNRLKRAETLGRGWFGRLAGANAAGAEPAAELAVEGGFFHWRSHRLGELQLRDAAHLAEDQPTGRTLDRLSDVLRAVERHERGQDGG